MVESEDRLVFLIYFSLYQFLVHIYDGFMSRVTSVDVVFVVLSTSPHCDGEVNGNSEYVHHQIPGLLKYCLLCMDETCFSLPGFPLLRNCRDNNTYSHYLNLLVSRRIFSYYSDYNSQLIKLDKAN